ncbi:MAG TPA: protein kinase [Myxococcaceae bacterium]|nr:protein kinase [Myxococcaceae bacterium]
MTSDFGYQLLTKLDDGPSGTAWRARARTSGGRAMVRVFHGSRWGDEDVRWAFQERADTLGRLDHPHLARQLQAGCLDDGRPYVVSEYLDGEDLGACLRRGGPLTPDELALLLLPLCSVLEELRGRGIVVQVLPPSQVFLVGGLPRFAPKLIGPGLGDAGHSFDPRGDVTALGRLMREACPEHLGWLEGVHAGCVLRPDEGGFASPAEVARALLEAQPRTQLLPTKEGGEQPPLLLVDESEREKPGDVLGQYRLERMLGEGAMGRVFQARHVSLGRPAAVKVLRAEHARNTHLIQRFFHEARAVNQINHAHIVEILDFVEETAVFGRSRVYCVMEMLEGHSLTDLLAREQPGVARTVGIVRQVCDALQAAHDVGVIHRDVKPDNLFVLERDGRDFVKVLDFGVAKLVAPLGDLPLTTTVEGTIVGTPAYMAPEQATGGNADARTDLYSVGVVLYELLAGHPPFQAPAFGQLVAQVLSSPPPPLPTHTRSGDRISGALWTVVKRCLAKNPDDRYPSLREMARALEVAAQAPVRRGPPPWMVAVGAMAVLGLGTGVVTVRSGRRLPAPLPVVTGRIVGLSPVAHPAEPPQVAPVPPEPLSPEPGVQVTVVSDPPGARVVELPSGRPLGTTPLSATFTRSSDPSRLRLEHAGRRPTEVALIPDAESEVHVALPRAPRTSRAAGKAKNQKHPDPFKL